MPDWLRLAFGALTAIPVPPPRLIDRRTAGRAMTAAPVALLPLAVVLGGLAWGAQALELAPLLVAALLVTLVELANRAMHLDGLADTADALSVMFDREKALRVMKQGDIGPSGGGAIVLVMLLDVAALTTLLARPGGWAMAAFALVASRHALAWACRAGIPAARPEGLGQAMAGTVPVWGAGLGTLVLGALGAVLALAVGFPWWAPVLGLGALILVTAATVARVTARLGGITGDILGFVIEAGFAALLVTMALLA